jgi:hypothetical protein
LSPAAFSTLLTDITASSDALAPGAVSRSGTLSDAATAVDAATTGTTGFAAALTDTAVSADLFTAVPGTLSFSLGDTAAAASIVSATFAPGASLTDAAASADTFNKGSAGYARVLADLAASTDSLPGGAVGSGPVVIATALPTGGIVRLDMPGYSVPLVGSPLTMIISRAVSDDLGNLLSPYAVIYRGGVCAVFLDVGDGLPGPLDASTWYVYQMSDGHGTGLTTPVLPSFQLIMEFL